MSAAWLFSLAAILVAICAALAAMGFRGRITTVGIDLGTTFSVIGINKNGKIIIIEDSAGHQIFPSVVSYADNGEILAAYQALPQLSKQPVNTIYNAKRFIGKSLDDDLVKQYASEHPFRVVESNTISNYSKVGFEITATGHASQVIAPEQIGEQVLRFLLKLTADYLGHNQVNKAVMAVPAKFGSIERQATAEAFKKAGLKVVRVIEEPTAAAVAYKLHKKSNIHHILVYDFGGGTLDVSILFVSKGSVQVYATDGDDTLGGSDLDLCLYSMMKDKLYSNFGYNVGHIGGDNSSPSDSSSSSSPAKGSEKNAPLKKGEAYAEDEWCSPASVHTKAENVKKALTSSETTVFSCTIPSTTTSDHNNERKLASFDVSKTEFEEGCAHLFERAMLPVTRLLDELQMTKDDIDEVVLVGGSTRIPIVKKKLRDFFQKELNDHIDPDITVAYGAASILD